MKKALFLLMALLPTQVFATDITCGGKITKVIDFPAYCNGNLAFKLDTTSNIWICSSSTTGNAMILSGQATKRTLSVALPDGALADGSGAMTCATLISYKTPRYMLLTTD
ncbi:MAG: hypothetical protein MJK04_04735 [Psychrosphaera sp.]|nr:hypothetical protein [Psychrosphaera sp.]